MAMSQQKIMKHAMKQKAVEAGAKMDHACFGKPGYADGGVPLPVAQSTAATLGNRAAAVNAAVDGAVAGTTPVARPVVAPVAAPAAPAVGTTTTAIVPGLAAQLAAKHAADMQAEAARMAAPPPAAPSVLQKAKAVFGFADGGSPWDVSGKYNVAGAADGVRSALKATAAVPTTPALAAAPEEAAAVTQPPRGAFGNLFAHGGAVHGPGTGTSDSIPVMVSKGEYILPADTVQAVGKENLDDLKAKTHTPVKAARFGFANGTETIDYSDVAPPRESPQARAYRLRPAYEVSTAPQVVDPAVSTVPGQQGPSGEIAPKVAKAAAAEAAPAVKAAQAAEGAQGVFGKAYQGTKALVNGGKGLVKGAGVGALAGAGIAAAGQEAMQSPQERNQYQADMGLLPTKDDGEVATIAKGAAAGLAHTVQRTWDNTGIPALFGSGTKPAPVSAHAAVAAPVVAASSAPAGPSAADLTRVGVPATAQATAPLPLNAEQRGAYVRNEPNPAMVLDRTQYRNLGDYGAPGTAIFGRASTPGGKINDFAGVGGGKPVPDNGVTLGVKPGEVSQYLQGLEQVGQDAQTRAAMYNHGRGPGAGGNVNTAGAVNSQIADLTERLKSNVYGNPERKQMMATLAGLQAQSQTLGQQDANANNNATVAFGQALQARTAQQTARLGMQGQIGANAVAAQKNQFDFNAKMADVKNNKDERTYQQMKDAQDRNYKIADNTAKSQFGSDPAQAEAYGSELKSLMDTMDFGGKSLHELDTHDRGVAMGQIQQQAMFNLEDRKHGQPGSSTGAGTTSKAGVGSLAWQSIKDGSPSEFGKGLWYGATKNKNGSVITNDRIPSVEVDKAVDDRGRKKKEQ